MRFYIPCIFMHLVPNDDDDTSSTISYELVRQQVEESESKSQQFPLPVDSTTPIDSR